jgi:hypothetical protein
MRVIILSAAAVFAVLAPHAFAQYETPNAPATGTYAPATPGTGAPAQSGAPSALPFGGPVPEVNAGPGLNIVGPDGVSAKTVKAVPCSTAARETDGSTTCVGISEKGAKAKNRR